MAIYQGRRKGTWRVVIWSQGQPHDTIVEGTKAEAKAHAAREALKYHLRPAVARVAPTFYDFSMRHYQPHAVQHLRSSTWAARKYQVAALVEFFGDWPINEIDGALVNEFKQSLKVGASTINLHLRILSAMKNWGRKMGYPFADFPIVYLPERRSGRVKYWTTEDVQKLFATAAAKDPDFLPLMLYLANTGCRKGEAIAAERDWIDTTRGMIRIPVNEYWQPKSGEPREVPISDALLPFLSAIPEGQRWVFPTSRGGRYVVFPNERFQTIVHAAGLSGGPHKFRHTFAAHFLMSVADLFLLAQVLGHSQLRVTELYSHLLPDHLQRARNAVCLGTMAADHGDSKNLHVSPKDSQ